jgi:anaerobic C4-dicarboxylate transporter
MEEKAKEIRLKKKSRVDLMLRKIKDISYFKRLFPLVKEEKPGKDMYAWITFWLFIICIYMINFYQYIDARGTQILQNTNQYSKNMTIMILILVGVLILERYIGRTNVRRHNKAIDAKKQLEKNKMENLT